MRSINFLREKISIDLTLLKADIIIVPEEASLLGAQSLEVERTTGG